jgi:hypothetical protein
LTAAGRDPANRGSKSPPSGQLSTWKEISAYLGVDARTAQRYEEELHLPVHRLDSGGRGRVYALADEIDAWRKSKTHSQPWWRTVLALQRVATGLAGLSTLLGVALLWALQPASGPATHFEYQGDLFVAVGPSGEPLWSYRLPKPPEFERGDRPRVRQIDLDGDGDAEILYSFRSDLHLTPDILFCFSSDGEKKWQFAPERSLADRSEQFSADYHVRAFQAIPSPDPDDETQWVAVASVAAWGYPSIVSLVDADGSVQREYMHSGQFESLLIRDIDGDGAPEIVAGGHNSARGSATVVVLDPATMGGASVEPPGSIKQLVDLPRATGVRARLFFPRSPVSLLLGEINTTLELFLDGKCVVAKVFEIQHTGKNRAYLGYVVEPDMTIQRVLADSLMLDAWDKARTQDPSIPALDEQELQRLADSVEIISNDPKFAAER